MGNRESAGASSASETDCCLESSTESTSISGYRVLLREPGGSQGLKSDASPLPSLRVTPPQPKPPLLSLPPPPPPRRQHSEALASDLCSVLNHHHDSLFEPADGSRGSCACRRSLSTGGCPAERPRILPIVRNGRQLSDDLFWVLPPRKKQQQQQQPDRLSSSTSSSNHSCCEPLSFCGPGCSPLDLVHRVTDAVFGVTDEESYLSLSLHHWDTDRAIRYLKVEQLFRQGVWDRDRCVKLLELHCWRLESVMQQLSRKRMCRSDSH